MIGEMAKTPLTSPRKIMMNSRNLLAKPSRLGTRITTAKMIVVMTCGVASCSFGS